MTSPHEAPSRSHKQRGTGIAVSARGARRPVTARNRRLAVGAAAAILSVAALADCSSSRHSGTGPPTSATSPASAARRAQAGTASARVGDLRISGGYIPQQASPDVAAAYFTVTNTGPTADTLARVTTNVTNEVMAMGETDQGSTGSMTDLPKVTVPAHGSFRFTQGHAHLMLEKPVRMLRQGDEVSMSITFTHAGTVQLTLPVVPLTGPTPGGASMSTMPGMSGMSSGSQS